MKWLITVLVLVLSFKPAYSYIITVDTYSEECFFDKVNVINTNLTLIFQLIDGGFLDIGLKITEPDGNVLHEDHQMSNSKIIFSADHSGIYTYCFINQFGSMAPKIVMFNMDLVPPEPPKLIANKPIDDANRTVEEQINEIKIEGMIKELHTSLWGAKREQEYMQLRDKIHMEINESSNFRLVLWSFFEATILLCMTVGQVFYIKRFFEVKRVV